jgi:2-polyprenyl-6-hydroxyphenyl methylase/3-demethylubiquinone-9 3-methyltransferase
VRLEYIKRQACANFGRDFADPQALKGLRLLDIGCGGGLLSEPMARMGAQVVGADASATNVEVAALHARQSGLAIDYRATTAEELEAKGETFDIILNMEVVEHVADVGLYIGACARMVRPGGLIFNATINRTLKAWALAIVAAEQVLRWLPRGTHSYDKLVRPSELEAPLLSEGLEIVDRTGVFYNPLQDRWNLSRDMDVNYMVLARRPHAMPGGN